MKISEIFRKDYIIEDLKARTKREALEELSAVFMPWSLCLNHDEIVSVLLARENLGSTGIGEGIAIPHGKHNDLNDLIVSFGRSLTGVEFNSMDGKPVHLFFLLMAPENTSGRHLKILAKISRMMKDREFRANLMNARTKDELYQAIIDRDEEC